jgi:multiple sugar transport system ATP-binding protein
MVAKLELREVEKRFDGVPAVKHLSFALEAGEFVSLLGPSGCGKSTTLAMIAGFETPTSGEIRIDGAAIDRLPPQRRRIGLVFQDYAVFSRLTVRANLSFGLEARRIGRRERERRVAEMAARLGLLDKLDRRGGQLNMSEMQSVALGRVLVTEPELVLLDEPMSNLDASLRARLRSELRRVQKQLGQTVLYVTHDQVEAMSMSDRIAVMSMGELQQIGTPDEIYRRPRNRFVAEFIGDPPINILPCTAVAVGGQVVATTSGQVGLVLGRGGALTGAHLLAIRPHDIRITQGAGRGTAAGAVRFVENLGSEHVLHIEYGNELLRAVVRPGFAAEGETVHLAFNLHRTHLIDATSGEVVRLTSLEAAA